MNRAELIAEARATVSGLRREFPEMQALQQMLDDLADALEAAEQENEWLSEWYETLIPKSLAELIQDYRDAEAASSKSVPNSNVASATRTCGGGGAVGHRGAAVRWGES